jgi:hypothetical protein
MVLKRETRACPNWLKIARLHWPTESTRIHITSVKAVWSASANRAYYRTPAVNLDFKTSRRDCRAQENSEVGIFTVIRRMHASDPIW